MQFTRQLTQSELTILGDNPVEKLNTIITLGINRVGKTNCDVYFRFLSLMSTTTPMGAQDITDAHNVVYSKTPISIAYARFVISHMHKAGLITRASRGKYVKPDDSRREQIKREIMQIEMTGRITGREKHRYEDLQRQLKELG